MLTFWIALCIKLGYKSHYDTGMSWMDWANLAISTQAVSFLHLLWLMIDWRPRQAQQVVLLEKLKSVDHGWPGAEQTEAERAEGEETQRASERSVLQSLHTSEQFIWKQSPKKKKNCWERGETLGAGCFHSTKWTRQSGTHLLDWAAEEDELRTSFLEDKEEGVEEEEVDFEGRKIEQWEALDKFNLNEKHKGFIQMWYSTNYSSQSKESKEQQNQKKKKTFSRTFVLYILKLNHNVNWAVSDSCNRRNIQSGSMARIDII